MSNIETEFSKGMNELPPWEDYTPLPDSSFVKPQPPGTKTKTKGDSDHKDKSPSSTEKLLITTTGTGPGTPPNVTNVQWLDSHDKVLFELSGIAVPADQFATGVSQTSGSDLYAFLDLAADERQCQGRGHQQERTIPRSR